MLSNDIQMQILFLTKTTELGASSRFRVYQFLPSLEERGVLYTVMAAIGNKRYTDFIRNPTPLKKLFRLSWKRWHSGCPLLRAMFAVFLNAFVTAGRGSSFPLYRRKRLLGRWRILAGMPEKDVLWVKMPEAGRSMNSA